MNVSSSFSIVIGHLCKVDKDIASKKMDDATSLLVRSIGELSALRQAERKELADRCSQSFENLHLLVDERQLNLLEEQVPRLLCCYTEFPEMQHKLARQLGDAVCRHSNLSRSAALAVKSMYYYGKAIQIAEQKVPCLIRETDQLASKLLMQQAYSYSLDREHFQRRFRDVLMEFENKSGVYLQFFKQLEQLKNFCQTDEDQEAIKDLYTGANCEIVEFKSGSDERIFIDIDKLPLLEEHELCDNFIQGPNHFQYEIAVRDYCLDSRIHFDTSVSARHQELLNAFFKHAILYKGKPAFSYCIEVKPKESLKSAFYLSELRVTIFVEEHSISIREYCNGLQDLVKSFLKKQILEKGNRYIDHMEVFPEVVEHPIKKYRREFLKFRSHFILRPTVSNSIEDVASFQEGSFVKFRAFFQILLDDVFAILGPPPCHFDIRAMGSCGRGELSVLSDLEPMILFAHDTNLENHKKNERYFSDVVDVLTLLITSLGETASSGGEKPSSDADLCVFTSIGSSHPIGFFIDQRLIGTTEEIANVVFARTQDSRSEDFEAIEPATASNMALKSRSLSSTTSLLFLEFQERLRGNNSWRCKRALDLLRTRFHDFSKLWPDCFDSSRGKVKLKDQYITLLNHLLSDFALYWNIDTPNFLSYADSIETREGIIDQLEKKGVFTSESAQLLKESIAQIYVIRVRLHQKSLVDGKNKDEAEYGRYLGNRLGIEEKRVLEKIYWLVLCPLYHSLEKVISREPEEDFDLEKWQGIRASLSKIIQRISADEESALNALKGGYDKLIDGLNGMNTEELDAIIKEAKEEIISAENLQTTLGKLSKAFSSLPEVQEDQLAFSIHKEAFLEDLQTTIDTLSLNELEATDDLTALYDEIRAHIPEEGHQSVYIKEFYQEVIESTQRNCLYHELAEKLKKIEQVQDRSKFERLFNKKNLVKSAFEMHFGDFSTEDTARLKPVVEYIGLELASRSAELVELKSYYQKLTKLEDQDGVPLDQEDILRETYIAALEKGGVKADWVDEIAVIPNRTGFRQSMRRREKKLRKQLATIMIPSDESNENPSFTTALFSGSYQLRPEVNCFENGDIRKEYKGSQHNVCRVRGLGYDLHLKGKPLEPLKEYAVYNLTSRIAGGLTPVTELVRFEIDGKPLPVLVSETLGGCINEKTVNPSDLDPNQLTWHLLCAILTHPADGKLSNYTLKRDRIYSVDNDVSFFEPVIKRDLKRDFQYSSLWQVFDQYIITFSSVLFCLFPKNTPLDKDALKDFVKLDVEKILEGWVQDVEAKQEEYKSLFQDDPLQNLFEGTDQVEETNKTRFTPTIVFREGTLSTLYYQFCFLQDFIKKNLDKGVKIYPADLLDQLISLKPDFETTNYVGGYVRRGYEALMKGNARQQIAQFGQQMGYHSSSPSRVWEMYFGKIPDFSEISRLSLQKAKEEFPFLNLKNGSHKENIELGKILRKTKKGWVIHCDFRVRLTDRIQQPDCFKSLAYQVRKQQNCTEVVLKHSSMLNFSYLSPFLTENLRHLDVTGSPHLNDADIVQIAKRCPNLKTLILNNCDGLQKIIRPRDNWANPSKPILFQALRHLEVRRCKNLEGVWLEAPYLEYIRVTGSSKLKTFNLKTSPIVFGKFICKGNSQVRFFHSSVQRREDGNYLYGVPVTAPDFQFGDDLSLIISLPIKEAKKKIKSLKLVGGVCTYEDVKRLVKVCPNLNLIGIDPKCITDAGLNYLEERPNLILYRLNNYKSATVIKEQQSMTLEYESRPGSRGSYPFIRHLTCASDTQFLCLNYTLPAVCLGEIQGGCMKMVAKDMHINHSIAPVVLADGRIAYENGGLGIEVLDIRTGEEMHLSTKPGTVANQFTHMAAYKGSNRLLALRLNGDFEVWNMSTGSLEDVYGGFDNCKPSEVLLDTISSEGIELFAFGAGNKIQICRVSPSSPFSERVEEETVQSLLFVDSEVIAYTIGNKLKLWDIYLETISEEILTRKIVSFAKHPKRKVFACALANQEVVVIDQELKKSFSLGKCAKKMFGPYPLIFLDNGVLIVANQDKLAIFYNWV